MAGSSRDVELVIRARDESTKAITAIGDALSTLTGLTAEAGQGAQKFDGLLGELGSALGNLQKQATGLQALGTVAKQIDRASEAVERLENVSKTAFQSAQGLAEQQTQLAEAGNQLAASQARVKTELTAAKEALAASAGAGEKSLGTQKALVTQLTAELKSLNTAATNNQTAQGKLARDVAAANAAFERSRGAMQQAATQLAEIKVAAEGASAVLGGIAVKQEAIGAASRATAESLNQVGEALKRQGTGEAGATALGPAATNTAAYRAQVEAVAQARVAFEQAREAASRLGQQMAATEAPTRDLAAQFALSKAASAEARTEYEAQARAMNALKGVTQGSFAAFNQSASAMESSARASSAMVVGLQRIAEIGPEAVTPLTVSIRELLTQMFKIPEAADAAGGGMRRMGDGGRESLSMFQRLRGEVLSLTLSFFGLFGAIQAVGSVISTVANLENAQARLAVVFDGDQARSKQELQFLMGEAERLGIEFNTLAGEYTKVSIAGKEMGFTNESIRTVFVALAEAGRVAGISASETDGIFQGLSHSIDRGTLNARNFNNQIGMRIPGSMKAMADAVGVSVQKFDELQRSGGGVAASQETLVRFAENLKKEFAGELPQSLDTVTAQLGRLKTFLQEGELKIGDSGFTAALKSLITDLETMLSSDGGAKAFEAIGQSLGAVVNGLKLVLDNWGLVSKVAEFFIGLKVAEYMLGLFRANGLLATSFAAAQVQVRGLTAGFAALNMEKLASLWSVFRAQVIGVGTALAEMGAEGAIAAAGTTLVDVALGTMEAVMVAVTATARAMWVAVGGFPGLLLTAATIILGNVLAQWIGGLDTASSALENHEALLQRIIDDYHKAAESADDFAKKALQSSTVQLLADELKLRQDLAKTQQGGDRMADGLAVVPELTGGTAQSQQRLAQVIALFQQGKLSAVDFKAALNDLATADPGLDKSIIAQLQNTADTAAKTELAIKKDQAALALIQGTATEAQRTLLGLADAAKAVSNAFDATAIGQFNDALEKLQGLAPDTKPSVKLQENLQSAQQDFKNALQAVKLNDEQTQEALKGAANIPGLTQAQMDAVKKAYAVYQEVVADLNARFTKAQNDAIPKDSSENLRQRIERVEGGGANRSGPGGRPSSSASGIGQFTEKTWLGLFDQVFPELIDMTREAKLAMRSQKAAADKMLDELIRQNQGILARAGIAPNDANTYLAHFLGGPQAVDMIRAGRTNPNQSAAALDPAAAAANPTVFFHRGANGRPDRSHPLTIAELEAWSNGKMGGGQAILANGQTKQEEFNAQFAEWIKALKDNTEAVKFGPREAFIQSKLSEQEKRAGAAGLTLSKDQRNQAVSAAGASFDAAEAEREKGLVAGLVVEINNLTKGEQSLTREQYIAAEATKDHVDVLTIQGEQYAKLKGQIYDLQAQQKAYNDVIGLGSQRKDLAGQVQAAFKDGDADKVRELQAEIADITAKLKSGLPDAIAFAKALGDHLLIATLDKLQGDLGKVKTTLTDTKSINQDLATGLSNAFKTSADALGKFIQGGLTLKGLFGAIGESFLNFAADFLEKIAQMILQQELLNLLQKSPIGGAISGAVNGIFGDAGSSAGLSTAGVTLSTAGTSLIAAATALTAAATALSVGAGIGSGISSAGSAVSGLGSLLSSFGGGGAAGAIDGIIGLLHGGGVVGAAGGQSRSVWPGVFANAGRMHAGGIAGLGTGEYAKILKQNEEVLTEDNPRHIFNQQGAGGGGGAPAKNDVKIVNMFDAASVLSEALNTTAGQKAIINHVRQNKRAIGQILAN